MSARWFEVGVGTVRGDDGVWRQSGDTNEFVHLAELQEEGEEGLVELFAALVDHDVTVSSVITFPADTDNHETTVADGEPASAWEMELLLREATIESIEGQLAKVEKSIRVLEKTAAVVRGKTVRIAELRAALDDLRRDLATAIAKREIPPVPKLLDRVSVEHLRRVSTATTRARRPRDPNKIQ